MDTLNAFFDSRFVLYLQSSSFLMIGTIPQAHPLLMELMEGKRNHNIVSVKSRVHRPISHPDARLKNVVSMGMHGSQQVHTSF